MQEFLEKKNMKLLFNKQVMEAIALSWINIQFSFYRLLEK